MSGIGHNGGPAFPNPALADEAYHPSRDETGMTLRDYFAAASIQGLRSNPHAWAEMTADEMVEAAWRDADAMIEAREATS